jgi:serine/threonine-protein kinase
MAAASVDDSQVAAWTCPTCGGMYPGDYAVCPRDETPRVAPAAGGGDALIGAVLGRTYRIARVLGEGGMARLYEAEHLRIDARFAVKVIHDDLARDPALIARFEREARAAGRIHSDHAVELVDVLRTGDGRPCLVTELLDGEDLQVRLDRAKKLSVAEAIPIIRQLCYAVADAHAVGVVHRDLKPSNVFLCTRHGEVLVKVLDFGVAKLEDDDRLTRTDAVMGTAAYMAPEQARRAADAGPLADVYSIGAVLYHVLAGEPPYGHLPPISRLALLLHEEPARPRALEASIPEGVEAVIQHAMARDPAARTQSALEVADQLDAFEAPPPAPTTTSRRVVAVDPTGIAQRARFARPLAIMVAVASSLGAGAWTAALLGAIDTPSGQGERVLIGLVAAIAAIASATVHVRRLRPSWDSAPAVLRHTTSPARAFVVGAVVFGALTLVADAAAITWHGNVLGDTARLVATGAAAALALAWRRLGLGERLAGRIG